MAGLGNTVAQLLQQQSNLAESLSRADLRMGRFRPIRGDGLLEEVAGLDSNPGNLRMLRYHPEEQFRKLPRWWLFFTDAPRTRRPMRTAQAGLNLRIGMVFAS